MYFFETVAEKAVRINFDAEISYGQEEAYVSYPTVFPTVTFELESTDILCQAADKVNDEKGEYTFYIGINGYSKSKVDNCIDFTDDYDRYSMELTEDEQDMIYEVLNRQLKEKLGKSCDDLLKEAEKQIKYS